MREDQKFNGKELAQSDFPLFQLGEKSPKQILEICSTFQEYISSGSFCIFILCDKLPIYHKYIYILYKGMVYSSVLNTCYPDNQSSDHPRREKLFRGNLEVRERVKKLLWSLPFIFSYLMSFVS